MFVEFINQYGTTILYALITAVAGYIGLVAKHYAKKWFDTREKKAVARTAVQAVEQVYKDLHGPEKLEQALIAAEEMLAEKGIAISSLELRMLIEAALAEFNKAFEKGKSDPAEPASHTDEAVEVVDGVDADDLDLVQLRAIALQMGLALPIDATRADLLDAIEAAAAATD